jgi:hypothetical protein
VILPIAIGMILMIAMIEVPVKKQKIKNHGSYKIVVQAITRIIKIT